jgi:DNA-binding response OmpR family regulator
LKPEIPVIITSGARRDKDQLQCIDTTHLTTLEKPYTVEQLLNAVADGIRTAQGGSDRSDEYTMGIPGGTFAPTAVSGAARGNNSTDRAVGIVPTGLQSGEVKTAGGHKYRRNHDHDGLGTRVL